MIKDRSKEVLKQAVKGAHDDIDQFCANMAMAAVLAPPAGAPRDTGNLADTITHQTKGLVGVVYTQTGKKDGGAGYGIFVHEGYTMKNGRQIPANPYFRRAFEEAKK